MLKRKEYYQLEQTINFTMFVSLAITLSIFDSIIPINFLIPGIKLGIANIIIVILLDYYSLRKLLLLQIVRVTITAFILGLFSVYFFSLFGACFSLISMYGAKGIFKGRITTYTLSMIGAIAHNLGQILFAIWYLKTPELYYYIPFLVAFGSVTGFLMGIVVNYVKPIIERTVNVKVK